MRRNKFLIIILVMIVFFANQVLVEAKSESASLKMKSTSGNCSKYFSVRSSSEYEHEVRSNAKAKAEYTAGKLKAYTFANGSKADSSKEFDSSDKVTTAWYFITPKGGEKFKSGDKLTIDVYSNNKKVCSADITGFSTSKDNVKVALQHDGIIQSITLKGTFKNGSYTAKDEINLKVVKSTSTTKLNVSNGTRKGKQKANSVTDSNGNFSRSSTSCTDVSALIGDYWGYVMIIVPVLLIIMMSIDFLKAMSTGEADALNKAGNNAVKRTIAAVVLLALPALLRMIFGWFGIQICI